MEKYTRMAFKMRVYKDKFKEYEERHKKVYKELEEAIKEAGARNYTIFLDEETGDLFGTVEVGNIAKWEEISQKNICKKWWDYMADIMETNEDNSPKSTLLKEVYHLN